MLGMHCFQVAIYGILRIPNNVLENFTQVKDLFYAWLNPKGIQAKITLKGYIES